ncbi:hypothetical protein GCM10022258_34390 [Aquimarina gracilis]
MNIINIIIGCLLIVLGILVIIYYEYYMKKESKGALSFKLRVAGIGLIIIGLGLIMKEF